MTEVTPPSPLQQELQRLAFRALYASRAPVPVAHLAAGAGVPEEEAGAAVTDLRVQGRMRVDETGAVVGSSGLSVVEDRHEMWVGDDRFWTWCALDAVGILSAFGASGRLVSRSPASGARIEVAFVDGRAEPTPAVVFIPSVMQCASIYDDWCSLLNLFEDPAAAEAWIETQGIEGSLPTVDDLAAAVVSRWRPLTDGLRP